MKQKDSQRASALEYCPKCGAHVNVCGLESAGNNCGFIQRLSLLEAGASALEHEGCRIAANKLRAEIGWDALPELEHKR